MRIYSRAQHFAVNAFLLFHIFAITCWCIPIRMPLFELCRSTVRPYLRWSGLFQSWDVFGPEPLAINSHLEAIVVYANGERKTWAFPRMEQLSLTARYFKERYRKFEESLQRDENDALWPDVARRIARENSSPSTPVKTVILIQKWSFIVPRSDGSYVPEPWNRRTLFGYGVRPWDLP
jgi:hypothetical protein